MDKQPTAILLLFTDYLDNRDSIAFLRLSSSVFSSHRSSTGFYRLKHRWSLGEANFPRPSELPKPYFLPSLHSGHYLCDSWRIENSADLAFLFPPKKENSSPAEKSEEIQDKRKKLKTIQLNPELLKDFPDEEKFPDFIENLFFLLSRSVENPWRIEFLQRILPPRVKKINFGEISTMNQYSINANRIDFSGFSHLESLKSFRFPLRPGLLPSGLKELEYFCDEEIPEGSLPDSLESLSFLSYNHPLPSKLPTGLRMLDLSYYFDHPINPGQLPRGLKKIKFSQYFNQILQPGVFPSGLEEVEFSYSPYSHPLLPGIFPASLKKLYFRISLYYEYSHPILSGVLPDHLEELELSLGKNYSQPLPILPTGLKCLDLYGFMNLPVDFPPDLPQQLRSIQLRWNFNSPLPPGIFPPSLEDIQFGLTYNFPLEIGVFPPGIKKIILGKNFDSHLPVGIFPQGTRAITFGKNYSYPLEVGLFPSSLRELTVSTSHPLPLGVFPEGLESLLFHSGFNEVLLPGIFPSSLRSLKFSAPYHPSCFTQDILPGVLPEFLCHLDLGENYAGMLTLSALPPYFVPDSSSAGQSKVFYRLKPPSRFLRRKGSFFLNRLIERIGCDRQFLVKSLRAPVAFTDSRCFHYFLVSPFDGLGEDFLVSESFLEEISRQREVKGFPEFRIR